MSRKLIAALAAASIALSICAPLAAQQATPEAAPKPSAEQPALAERPDESAAELEARSRQAYADGDYLAFYVANLKLHNMFPYVPQYLVDLVRACARLERNTTAYHYMYTMQQQGLSYDFNSTEDTESIRNTQAYDYINNLLIDAGKPAGDGTIAATLPGPPQNYGAVAWDGTRQRVLLGTVAEGRLLAVAEDGSTETMLQADDDNGLWSITGLAVDPKNNRLWVATTASTAFEALSPADRNRASLVEFELDSLNLAGRYNVPVDALHHELGSVAVTEDGHVYVIDTAVPVVFRKTPGADRLEAFVASDRLVGFTDIAVAPDNSRLFVSDPVMGVFLVDPREQQAAMLGTPETLNLAGIDGIAFADRKLFVVQGGISPQRIMRLELDAAGLAVESVSPMAIALEPFDWPRLAALGDGKLVYLANQGGGDAEDAAIVMSTPLDAGSTIEAPDMDDLQRALQSRQQSGRQPQE